MGNRFECPFCEAEFEVETPGSDHSLTCPFCEREFSATAEMVVSKMPVTASPQPKMVASPAPSIGVEQVPVAKPIARPTTAKEPLESASQELDQNAATLRAMRENRKRRNRKRTVGAVVVGVGLTISIVALLVVLANQLSSNDLLTGAEDPSTSESTDLAEDAASAQSPDASRQQDPGVLAAKSDKDELPSRRLPLPPQKFEFLSAEEADDVWAVAQPRVVSLTIHKLDGISRAIGTLVDSRGWVVTSHRAIAGATRVEVTSAAKSLDTLQEADLLRDEVRGVIASDPDNDLVLLAVNRRFVVSFGKLTFADELRLVIGKYLIQAAPPTALNPYARDEVQILDRITQDQLPGDVQLIVNSTQPLKPAKNWLVLESKADPLPGTPLFNRDGELAGMQVLVEGDRVYALPTDTLADLIANANDEAQPLQSTATEDQRKAMADAIAESHSMNATSTRLNQLGRTCDGFGWIPTEKQQYRQLQRFGALASEVLLFTLENRNNEDEAEVVAKLKSQMNQWRRSMSRAIAQPDADQLEQLVQMNKLARDTLAKQQLKGGDRVVPFFGRVFAAGIVSPDPDSMFLKLRDEEAYVRVPFQSTGDAMLPDTRWLFFVKRQATRQNTRHEYTGIKFDSTAADLQFAIGPLDY